MWSTSRAFLSTHVGFKPKSVIEKCGVLMNLFPTLTFQPCAKDTSFISVGDIKSEIKFEKIEEPLALDLHHKKVDALLKNTDSNIIANLSGKDPAKVRIAIEASKSSAGGRLRYSEDFEESKRVVTGFLKETEELDALVEKASPIDKNRFSQIIITPGGHMDKFVVARGLEFGLKMGAKNLTELMSYIEFFKADMTDIMLEAKIAAKKRPLPSGQRSKEENKLIREQYRAELLNESFGEDTLDPELFDSAAAKFEKIAGAAGSLTGPYLATSAFPDDFESMQKSIIDIAEKMCFLDAPSAVYHFEKHRLEFPSVLTDMAYAEQFASYLTVGQDIIKTGKIVGSDITQNGTVTLVFRKGDHSCYVGIDGISAYILSIYKQ